MKKPTGKQLRKLEKVTRRFQRAARDHDLAVSMQEKVKLSQDVLQAINAKMNLEATLEERLQ